MSQKTETFELVCDVNLRARLIDLRAKIAPILSNRLHTHFTDHSVAHSDRLAALGQQLLQPLRQDLVLNDAEAFVFYGGCYYHDSGMHNEIAGTFGRLAEKLKREHRTWAVVQRDERLDLIRRHHHEVSADMVIASVRNAAPPVGQTLTDLDHPSHVAAICEAHCVDTASDRYSTLTRSAENSTMRLRLLAAILRLADILDEAHHRALVEQARTLDLSLESRMHWWRHYYTREVEVEPSRNRVTIWFEFPRGERDEYSQIIPALQMPWIEQEFARHREVFAENGLSWHIAWQVRQSPFDTVQPMPPEVKGLMLRDLARIKQNEAQRSQIAVLKQLDQAHAHIKQQFDQLDSEREDKDSEPYLHNSVRFAQDLWQVGGRKTAWTRLMSSLHFATTNGRTVPAEAHVSAAITLAKMMDEDGALDTALQELSSARHAVEALEDHIPAKGEYQTLFASIALRAGYTGDGSQAAAEAMRLAPTQEIRDDVRADLAEAQFLGGSEPATPSETTK